MKLLGIDYGRAKIGLATSEGRLAEPFMVLKVKSQQEALNKLASLIKENFVEKVVIGTPGGTMDKEIREFGKLLEEKIETEVVFQDETLTTQDAQALSIKAGIKRSKRKRLEDAFSAVLMLQDFIGY